MKKIISVLTAMSLLLGMLASMTISVNAAKPSDKGFDEFGYNYGASLYNGWYGQYLSKPSGNWSGNTEDARLVMKWSKDWTPQQDEPVGAWTTNHFTWYSNDIDESTWYGWDTRVSWDDSNNEPFAKYKIVEFLKIMKVGDDQDAWDEYQQGGAYSAGWGSYSSGVPKYVVFQDVITIYERSWNVVGEWTIDFLLGSGTYSHSMAIITQQINGEFSGTGYYMPNSEYTWIVTGQVSGDSISFDIDYTNLNPDYWVSAGGVIAPDGTLSGTWNAPGQFGTWTSSSGTASSWFELIIDTDLCTTSPKGLGKPIF